MPLVRLSGSDAATFDTFDVAEMTDHRTQRNSWSLLGTPSGAASSRHSTSNNGALSPTPEDDDLISISSSSGRKSEEADRVGSIPCLGMNGGGGMHSRRQSHSSAMSAGSSASCRTSPTVSVSMSGNSGENYNSASYNNQPPLYENTDNLDEVQNDPRNPFNKSQNSALWGDHIPEEDETSLSTMEDSSQSQHNKNQQSSRSNSISVSQPQQHRTNRNSRQRQIQSSSSDLDDISISSHQSHRQDFNNKKTANNNINDNSSHMIQQLESLVAKLNFELATTKSSLDELQLENRRLNSDRDKLSTNMTLLKEENEQLHLKIERLEKEKILRNMEGTKGVVRSASDLDLVSKQNGVGGASSSVASAAINRAYVPVSKQRLGKVAGGNSLEVPFRTAENDYHLRPRRSSQSSLCSVSSYNEYLASDCDLRSLRSSAGTEGNGSTHSIPLNDSGDNLDSHLPGHTDEQEPKTQRGRLDLINNMLGEATKQSVRELRGQINEVVKSSQNRRSSRADGSKGEASAASSDVPTNRSGNNLKAIEDDDDDDDIGSNPQGEGEDFNDEDPFATWSAPGDPKRIEPERNWLQRGLGRHSMTRKPPQSNGDTIDDPGLQGSMTRPQTNGTIDDPFDILNCDNGQDMEENNNEKYASFADNPSDHSCGGAGADDSASVMKDRKRFGLFGLIGGGRAGARR